MKTMKYFFMAALALMTAACSNEDNEITQQPQNTRGIPFTVTLSMGESATTRALTPNGNKIDATWETGDKVALIYTVGETTYKKDATVTAQTNGTATVSTTLEGSPLDGSTVTIIYPSTAADKTTNDYIKTGLLEGQDGTLAGIAAKYDVRKGTGKLSISGSAGNETATVYDDNRTNNLVKLENQYSIFKFSVRDINGEAFIGDMRITEFKVSDNDGNVKATFTGNIAASDVYVALPKLTAGKYWFNASLSDGTLSKPYIAKATATATTAGKYYPVTVKMATIGDFILSDGTFAAANTTTTTGTPVAMITYLGNATGHEDFRHGLALAMNDENSGNGLTWSTAKNTYHNKASNVTDASSWMLPSETQWTNMDDHVRNYFNTPGLYDLFHDDVHVFHVTGATNLQYKDTDNSHILYWSYTSVDDATARAYSVYYTPYWFDDPKANAVNPYKRVCRTCLAF